MSNVGQLINSALAAIALALARIKAPKSPEPVLISVDTRKVAPKW